MPANAERIFLLPGEYYVSRTPCHMATLLGSCVAVCLRHESRPYAAMNHYLLAASPSGSDPDKGRYGDTSIETILWLMRKLDDKGLITAKIYGGGAVVGHLGATSDIGGKNIEMARALMRRHGIPIVAEDVGGTIGRRIYFDTAANKVVVKPIQKSEDTVRTDQKRREMASRRVRVLVVDDSALVRKILVQAISETLDLEVCGEAADAFEARDKILELNPDVISLDIIMPRLDGLKFLKSLSQHYPKPVVICSTIAKDQSQVAAKAREYGAVEVIDKDSLQLYKGLAVVQEAYIPKLRRAAATAVRKLTFKD